MVASETIRTNKNVSKAVAYLHEEPKQEVKEEAPKPKTLYFRKEYGDCES